MITSYFATCERCLHCATGKWRHTTPDWTPPAPRPAMALPMMKATELGAAPQMAEPTSNNTRAVRKVAFKFRKVYSFPNTNRKAQLVSRYAVPYQPTSFEAWNSFVIAGVAVDMMSLSCKHLSAWTRSVWTLNIRLDTYQRHQKHGYIDRCHQQCEFETRRVDEVVILFSFWCQHLVV